jgi:hypothetical protein
VYWSYGYETIRQRTSYVDFIFIDGRFFNGEKQVGYRRTVNEELGAGNLRLKPTFEGDKYFQKKVATISYGQLVQDRAEEQVRVKTWEERDEL